MLRMKLDILCHGSSFRKPFPESSSPRYEGDFFFFTYLAISPSALSTCMINKPWEILCPKDLAVYRVAMLRWHVIDVGFRMVCSSILCVFSLFFFLVYWWTQTETCETNSWLNLKYPQPPVLIPGITFQMKYFSGSSFSLQLLYTFHLLTLFSQKKISSLEVVFLLLSVMRKYSAISTQNYYL